MYGTQAEPITSRLELTFENDVKMYGTQAASTDVSTCVSLRMM